MITQRPATSRGHANHGWLDSWHSFSFAEYYDDKHVHWGPLRVINEDRVAAGRGFGQHGHRDMEIISYVLEGALGHKDSMGTSSSIVPGDVQRMSAGTGVQHSEFNYSETGTAEEKQGRLRLVVSSDGADGSISIHQDARLYAGLFDGDEAAVLRLAEGRLGYVHVARGEVTVNGHTLSAGDALLYEGEPLVSVGQGIGAEVLVFDLPPLK